MSRMGQPAAADADIPSPHPGLDYFAGENLLDDFFVEIFRIFSQPSGTEIFSISQETPWKS